MATQLMLPSLARCGASHCQPSSSGRQATGAVPVAPPCGHGLASASLGGLPRRALLVARQPPKPVTLAPHLQLGCGSASRRRRCSSRTGSLHCRSSAGVAQPGEVPSLSVGLLNAQLTAPTTAMAKRGLGSSGGAAVLERQKLNLSQKTPTTSNPKLDDSGGAGGIGKILHNGGGGDDDGGDDDDYFNPNEGDGGDDGDGFFKGTLKELYDRKSIQAVLSEWGRTFTDIPVFFRQSAELGLFSSAQLVRFVSTDVRPSMTRSVTRALPHTGARAFVGRLMADPAFAQKLVLEGGFSVLLSLAWEAAHRGDRFVHELDYVAINTLCLAASTGAFVWLMAPNRSAGAAFQSSWQSKLSALPGNVFDRSTPVHQLSWGTRTGSLLWKSAQLAAVGAGAGAAMSILGSASTGVRRMQDPSFSPAVEVPSLGRSTLGMALNMGTIGNLRYQGVAGLDRVFADRINFMWVGLLLSASFRAANQWFGQGTRCFLQGLPFQVPEHKLLQRHRAARSAELAAAEAQLAAFRRHQAAQAAKPKRRPAQTGSAGFEMSTQRQHSRQQQPSMALA